MNSLRFPVLLILLSACARTRHVDPTGLAFEPATSVWYADMLRSANVEGSASVRVGLDSTGRVVPGSMRVLSSTHELFTLGIRKGVDRWSFPAIAHVSDSITVDVQFYVRDEPGCPWHTPTFQNVVPMPGVRERLTRGKYDRPLLLVVACSLRRSSGGNVF